MRLARLLRRYQFRPLCALLLLLSVTGCSSLGSKEGTARAKPAPKLTSLPVEAMRAIAKDIESQIVAVNREPLLRNRAGIIVDTPEIVQAVRTRAVRSELVSRFLDTGHAWERRNSRLWIIRSAAYKAVGSSRTRDIDALMVNSENIDRRTIYGRIIKNSRLPSKFLSEVEEIFFEARVELMKPGQKYENAEGETVVKE